MAYDNGPLLAAARPLIAGEEGCRLVAYPDPISGGDPWTIGYGHTGPEVHEGVVWPQGQADAVFDQDALEKINGLDANISWWRDLSIPRQCVLLSMAFNMGVNGLLGFGHTLSAIKSGAYYGASAMMLQSEWAHQVPSRAEQLSEIMKTGGLP